MTKQHRQSPEVGYSPGPGPATQPGDPGAVFERAAELRKMAPGHFRRVKSRITSLDERLAKLEGE